MNQLAIVISSGLGGGLLALAFLRYRHRSNSPFHAEQNPDRTEEYLLRRERRLTHRIRNPKRLPCCLVTGEFGSGKTTLIKHLLIELKQNNISCGVIVNDYCDLGIDVSNLSQTNPDLVVPYSSHCCCCFSLDDDDTTGNLHQQIRVLENQDVDVLIIETNGSSRVQGAILAVQNLVRLDTVIGVVDGGGSNNNNRLNAQLESYCDVICVNKSDLNEGDESHWSSTVEKVDLLFTRFGKIPLEKAFRGSRFPFVPGQLSVREAKQSARFVLAKEEDDFSPHRSLSENRQEGEEIHTESGRLIQSSHAVSFAYLQHRVNQWHASKTLKRIKGQILLQLSEAEVRPIVVEFQYSGRGRLHCVRRSMVEDSSIVFVQETRLAIVSGDASDFIFEQDDAGIQVELPLVEDHRLSQVRLSDNKSVLSFQITCRRRFGFSSQQLLDKFGVELPKVQLDFHNRFNGSEGSDLVMFDGVELHLATFNREKFNKVLTQTVEANFAVVKSWCRCDDEM